MDPSNSSPNGIASGIGQETRLTIILIVSFIVGSLIGGIFVCCASLAIWFLGALVGYTLALFIISWTTSIHSPPASPSDSSNIMGGSQGRTIFIIALAFAGFLLTCIFENMVIILGTSFIGSYATVLGVEIFVKTNFVSDNTNLVSILNAILNGNAILDGNNTFYETNTLLLAGMIVLFVVGALYQFNFNVGPFYPNGLNHTPKPIYSRFKNRKISSWNEEKDSKTINIV